LRQQLSDSKARRVTDPRGPDATRDMPRFFRDHRAVERNTEARAWRKRRPAGVIAIVIETTAGDGLTGLKILQSDARIDLLISDVGLPGGMNGRQVADAARGQFGPI